MTHPDFGERGFEEELTPEQVAIVDLAKTVRVLKEVQEEQEKRMDSEMKVLREDIKKLEKAIWNLKNK